ncbi:MAG: sulfatase-like hydrolase/transferase [Planctomycetes bacterium]|nr:sulfatase-like hydrolase/transferase [Planctomycetota bacterium]
MVLTLVLSACSGRDPRPNVLLITLDTTRADALGCYAPRPGLTPNLDALARESVVFDRARTVAPLTLPAHASMLTGLYPPRHGARDNGLVPVPTSARTAAELLSDAGYDTAAFVSAAVLDASWGIAQGFRAFDAPPPAPPGAAVHIDERGGRETTERALAWLGGNASGAAPRREGAPFFAWVHLFDAHAPYEPAPEFLAQANGDAYLGEVAALDHEVGRVLDALRAAGELERTLVIVVADHGEALGQHGEPTHSIFCYEPVLRVPLLVRRPGPTRAGERSDTTVSVVDVLPTALASAGVRIPPTLDGRDLFAPADAARSVYFESYCGWLNYAWSPLVGAARGDEKYTWSGVEELVDVASDAREKVNLASARPDACAAWRAEVERLASGPALPRDAVEHVDAGARERVLSLGYAGAAEPGFAIPVPLTETGLPAPLARKAELAAYYAALELEVQGRTDAAIAGLAAVLAENPRNYAAGDVLGALLTRAGRDAEAVRVLDGLQHAGRERVTTHLSLATCLARLGRAEEELAHLERAVELQPEGRAGLEALARAYTARGRTREAQSIERRVAALRGAR